MPKQYPQLLSRQMRIDATIPPSWTTGTQLALQKQITISAKLSLSLSCELQYSEQKEKEDPPHPSDLDRHSSNTFSTSSGLFFSGRQSLIITFPCKTIDVCPTCGVNLRNRRTTLVTDQQKQAFVVLVCNNYGLVPSKEDGILQLRWAAKRKQDKEWFLENISSRCEFASEPFSDVPVSIVSHESATTTRKLRNRKVRLPGPPLPHKKKERRAETDVVLFYQRQDPAEGGGVHHHPCDKILMGPPGQK